MATLPHNWQLIAGRRLKQVRISAGLSRAVLAGQLDMGAQQLGNYERGEVTDPKLRVYLQAAIATGNSPEVFFQDITGGAQSTVIIVSQLLDSMPAPERGYALRFLKVLADQEK